jgi:hypothetical protein
MKTTETCEACGKPLTPYRSVNYGSRSGTYRRLCLGCCNTEFAREAGLDFQHADFQPIRLADADGAEHEFHFGIRLLGDRVALDAHEMRDGEPGGYEFQVMSFDPEGEPLELFGRLLEKMRRELARRHLERSAEFGIGITEDQVVRARVSCDLYREDGDRLPLLVIDGREISWEEFGRMLMTFEGWQFKLEIYDKSEER